MDKIDGPNVASFLGARIARLEKRLESPALQLPTVDSRRAWGRTALELLDLLDEQEAANSGG